MVETGRLKGKTRRAGPGQQSQTQRQRFSPSLRPRPVLCPNQPGLRLPKTVLRPPGCIHPRGRWQSELWGGGRGGVGERKGREGGKGKAGGARQEGFAEATLATSFLASLQLERRFIKQVRGRGTESRWWSGLWSGAPTGCVTVDKSLWAFMRKDTRHPWCREGPRRQPPLVPEALQKHFPGLRLGR